MEEIYKENPNFTGVVETIKSMKFWQNRWVKNFQFAEGYQRAEYLLKEWDNYDKFIQNSNIHYEKVIIYLKNFIFKSIIKNLVHSYQQSDVPNIDVLLQIGEIFLSIEENQKAIESLEYARLFNKKDSYLLSLLADAYYRIDSIDKAKVLFREAFLYDPQKIILSKIHCDFIRQLYDKIMEETGYSEGLILEWIGVYGVLLNVFHVKREINTDELSKLNMEIQEFENEFYGKKFNNEFILPKIINRYFWLLDYYTLQNNNKDYIDIYLNKLKEVNKHVYQQYVSLMERNSNEKVDNYE
ncbi:MAG: hypothetical protein KKH98_05465 [Spirochaetes bacterium]|nr:hypothetical protein [Spirochaetota bacterium]